MPDDPKISECTHENIMRAITQNRDEVDDRLDRGEHRFKQLFDAIEQINIAVQPIPAIMREVSDTKREVSATKEIVEAWAAVKTMGKFVKWVAPLLAALAVGWATVKGFFVADLKH